MNFGILNGVRASNANEKRLEAITANLANVDTPGYKRQSTAIKAFRVPGSDETDLGLNTSATTDFSQGDLRPSSNPFDLALMGTGFFAVEGPDGELYTRRGAFRLDQNGVLLTDEGYPVAWESNPGEINPTGDLITVDASGLMHQGNKEIGRIKVVDFANPQRLENLGGEYYLANRATPEKPSTATVHQHHLEASNVSSIDELVGMISIQRSFEASQNVMQLIDQTYSALTAP